jgi:hypothetical protein
VYRVHNEELSAIEDEDKKFNRMVEHNLVERFLTRFPRLVMCEMCFLALGVSGDCDSGAGRVGFLFDNLVSLF